jgi:hypothetical protein
VIVERGYVEGESGNALQRKPTDQLKSLENILDQLYKAIKENFDLAEVLLLVGDRRLRDHRRPHWEIARHVDRLSERPSRKLPARRKRVALRRENGLS